MSALTTPARRSWPAWTGRRGLLFAEIAVLVAGTVVDMVFVVRAGAVRGYAGSIALSVVSGLGTVAAVLAVLRRRLPDRVALLGGAVIGLSLLGTGLVVLADAVGQHLAPQSYATEIVALGLLVGAGCRRLPAREAVGIVLAGGLAMVAGPLLRDGTDNPLAVAAALVWGGALAAGLMLRDADARHQAALAAARERVRTAERMVMARELHDLVAHHITGVVVLAQAARVLADREPARDSEVFAEIERAGADALAATRRLVAVLRTGQDAAFSSPVRIVDAVDRAVPDDGSVTVTTSGLADLPATPDVSGAVHRVIMEALTNVRRHAPDARDVRVDVHVDDADWLVVRVVNDGVGRVTPTREGYGLVGMTERVTALGGTCTAGHTQEGRWQVLARVPLDRS